MVKIVTYNVNGLRPRVAQHGSLRRLLDALDADIICFQETKLSRQDLSADVIMAEGYEAFVSCNRSSKGRGAYSGVATFCRVTSSFSSQEVALPVAAEEGFTGLQDYTKKSDTVGNFIITMPVEEEGLGEIAREDLLRVDNEGRCIITDHGHFVLFNIYGPAVEEDDKERIRFKLLFYKILQKRWEHLLAHGKRVFVVGDLNIAPASIDRCDAPPGFEKQLFREWLRSMLREHGGPFFDAFRSKHPERPGAYTCFNQKIGAEEYNYGSRIDHILISGSCLHHCDSVEEHSIFCCHVEECEIMNHFKRGNSENLSMWKGGRSSKLEGSDHIPVYILLKEIPELPVHNIPPSAARYLPEVRGRQQSIVSFLDKGKVYELQNAANLIQSEDTVVDSYCSDGLENTVIAKEGLTTGITEFAKGSHSSQKASLSSAKFVPKKKFKRNLSSQLSIKSFFERPGSKTVNASTSTLVTPAETLDLTNQTCVSNDDSLPESMQCTTSAAKDQDNTNVSSCSPSTDKSNAALEWQRIQQKMKMTLPRCKGHSEPCIPRSVKKGPNIGRLFYVCARAQGPASNPEANCGHFQWAPGKSKDKSSIERRQ